MINERSLTLIKALQNAKAYVHPVEHIDLAETHISWVLLTGPYAYKIKKPVDLGFLDFTTLDKRRRFCKEELRLNRRLAPELYLAVVPITGTPDQPHMGGDGGALEYAVQMKQFPPDALLSLMLERGKLEAPHIHELAGLVAAFHQRAARSGDDPFGTPASVRSPALDNFAHIRRYPLCAGTDGQLTQLERWTEVEYANLADTFRRRKAGGFIRECHGDLHLGNIAMIDGHPTPFDCIEFNAGLRWIDVISEIAFVVMDLDARGRPEFGRLFLNTYLEITGDYGALEVLRFYQVYRAMVRAKVACISAAEGASVPDEYHHYLDLATTYTQPATPRLYITHGLSGSGKTTVAEAVVQATGAVRLRSDVERKRLHALSVETRSEAGVETGIYTRAASEATYARLVDLARSALQAGCSVVVDAAFLQCAQRQHFRDLAAALRVPFTILDCRAPESILRRRVGTRQALGRDASDATLAVLDHQLRSHAPLTDAEREQTIVIDTEQDDIAAIVARLLGSTIRA